MRILCVGSFVPNEVEHEAEHISAAGNRFQNNMWNHLAVRENVELIGCSYVGINLSKRSADDIKKCHDKDAVFEECKEFFINKGKIRAVLQTQQFLWKKLAECDSVICYNVIYAWLLLPFFARIRKTKSVIVLADYSDEKSFSSFPRKMYAKVMRWSIRKFDGVIGLSPRTEDICRKNQRFIHMEGGIDEDFFSCFANLEKGQGKTEHGILTFLYSGLLSEVTGVDILLKAISAIPNISARFVFSGKGPLADTVMQHAESDNRIIYKGHMQYDEYVECLKCSDILINPRNMTLPENNNNFPSKILDYLSTGKHIISTKFVGYEKYEEYIDFVESDYLALAGKIEQVVSLNPSNDFECVKKRRDFARGFLWSSQAKKMVIFMFE